MHEAPIIHLFGLSWNLSTILMNVVTSIIVFVIAVWGARNLSVTNPSKMQNFMEWLIDFVKGLISSTMDMKKGGKFLALGLTLIMYIFVGNMLGLPFPFYTEHTEQIYAFGQPISPESFEELEKASGEEGYKYVSFTWWKSPTADLSTTLALASVVILLSHFMGAVRNTGPYFKHYFEPHPAFFPLNIIKEISKFLTLGMRLYGNIYAGEVLISVILMAGIFGVLPLIVWQGFSIFVGAIQAFIFTILTMVYLSQALERHDH